jgi:hypothetical protein
MPLREAARAARRTNKCEPPPPGTDKYRDDKCRIIHRINVLMNKYPWNRADLINELASVLRSWEDRREAAPANSGVATDSPG